MNGQPVTPCQYARDRHRNLLLWRNLWTGLLFIFGATVVIFLSLAIILFVRRDWLPGVVSVVGTIADGAGMAWTVKRRSEAVQEEEAAYEDVKKQCFAHDEEARQRYDVQRGEALQLFGRLPPRIG